MSREWGLNKYNLIIVLMILFLPAICVQAGTYSGGDGSVENPYRIATVADMNTIGANPGDWDANFVMVNDVNLADYAGTQFNIIGNSATKFTGAFDGNDRTISSFSYTDPGADYVGLFGYVGEAAQIKNLGIVDVNVLGDTWVGGLVAYNKGTVSNCYAAGSVTGQSYHTGGLAGYNKGTISNCYAIGEVSGENDFTGGLVAFNVGTISNCYVFGSVIANDDVTGGL